MLLLTICEQLVVARDCNKLKDELEKDEYEIQVLKEELQSAKGLISCQANRLVITSSPNIVKQPTREVAPKSDDLNPPISDSLNGNIKVRFLKSNNLFLTLFANMTCTFVIAGSYRCFIGHTSS